MDEFKKRDGKSEIDLTEFDLTDFREYFEEEDAQREKEAREKEELELAKEASEIAEEEEKRIEEERRIEEEEKRAAEEFAAKKKAEFEVREKEEARKAAEKAAAAVLAAKKAEEAKLREQKEISARLLEQADVNNEMSFEQANSKTEPVVDNAQKIEFDQLSSILDINCPPTQETEQPWEEMNKSGEKVSGKENKKNIAATIICVILFIAVVVCGSLAFMNFSKKKDEAAQSSTPTTKDSSTTVFAPFDNLTATYNDTEYPASINENLKAMYSENNDLRGWLTIEGTSIDFPIVQDTDNKYYLSQRNVYDESSRYGTPFIDFRCNRDTLGKNTVIYGHKMKNGTHFGLLEEYADTDYYKKHPLIKYDTLTGSHTFKIYAVFYATTHNSVDGGYVFEYYNPSMSDVNFEGYIEMLNQYALYTTDAGLEKSDRIITLSTCAHPYDNLRNGGVDTRFVVVGRLLRDGESETVNNDKVTENADYRRPQIWYDKNGKTNPYSAYRNWKPSL